MYCIRDFQLCLVWDKSTWSTCDSVSSHKS